MEEKRAELTNIEDKRGKVFKKMKMAVKSIGFGLKARLNKGVRMNRVPFLYLFIPLTWMQRFVNVCSYWSVLLIGSCNRQCPPGLLTQYFIQP